MKSYFCSYLKRYVYLSYIKLKGTLQVYMVAQNSGEYLNRLTLDVQFSDSDCAFIDNKTYPWLSTWLVEKNVGHPTHRSLFKDGMCYLEFKFNKENF